MQLFPAHNSGARQLPHPRKPPLPHNDGSATDRASAWRACKSSADCAQRAVSPPGRTAACACDCVGLGFVFFLGNGRAQLWLPGRVCPGARATLLWHPLLRRMVEYQHQVIVDLQIGIDCTQCAVSPPGRTAACATLCLWRVGAFSKKKRAGLHCYWRPLRSLHQRLGTCTQVQIARTWLKAGTERTATRCSEPGRAICIVRLEWWIAVRECTATR